MNRKKTFVLVAFAGSMLTATAFAGPIPADFEVIYTKKTGHAKAQVPGQKDLAGDPIASEWRALEDLIVSYDGKHWILKGRNQLGSDLETNQTLGSDLVGNALAQEGQPIPGGAAGELFEFFSSTMLQFNDAGEYGFAARARGGVAAVFQKIMYWNGSTLKIVAQMGDLYVGLVDTTVSGDETAGNSIGSIQILNDGRFTAHDTTIVNINSLRRPAIFYSDSIHTRGTSSVQFTSFKQKNVSAVGGSLWDGIDSTQFLNTSDGSSWMAEGDDIGATTQDKILVVDDVVVMREGLPVDMSTGGTGPNMADVFDNRMIPTGDWMSRGDDAGDDDWFVINGVLIAKTGDAITPTLRGAESWGPIFLGINGNRHGDWVLVGNTNNADPATNEVIVYYDSFYDIHTVVAREGDPVDLDGNGSFDDDAFIGRATNTLTAFAANDVFITDQKMLYFIANLNDGAGNDLQSNPSFGTPDALMRQLVDPCPADLARDGVIDVFDLFVLLSNWGTDGDGAVMALPRNTVDVFDLFKLLSAWGPCFPVEK